jgi:hypothetical protein
MHSSKTRKEKIERLVQGLYSVNTWVASCVVGASFPSISDLNSKIVKGIAGPVSLKILKEHDKSFQHKKM